MQLEKRNLPLNALRAFEAVGRHLHMRKAAEEMCISHSAISQQIRKLEAALEAPLLERTNKGLQLTPAGGHLHKEVTEALEKLTTATLNTLPDSESVVLRIGCAYGLCSNWLAPKLESFLESYPTFRVKVDTIPVLPKSVPSEFDLIISYGKPPVSNDRVTRLAPSPLVPVSHSGLFEGLRPPVGPELVASHTLLHVDDGEEWKNWFAQAGHEGLTSQRNLLLAGYGLVIDAVRRGAGVGLLEKRWIENELETDQLTVLSDKAIHQPENYFIVRPEESLRTQAGRQFDQWLQEQWEQSL